MALTERIAPRRAGNSYVKKASITAFFQRIWKTGSTRRIPHLKDVPDHLLRDIGLSADDLAAKRLRLPSRHTHHPRG